MIIHFSILLVIMITCYFNKVVTQYKIVNSAYVMPRRPWVLVFGYIAILAALRSGMNDTSVYIFSFESIEPTWEGLRGLWNADWKDKNFDVLACIFKMLISDNYHMWFLLFSVVESICFIHVYRRESYSVPIVCFYFFASMAYYNYFSVMRQWMAVALLFGGFKWMKEKKWAQYFLLCVLAAQLHSSAYLGIVFYLLAQGKPWQLKQLVLILGACAGIFILEPMLNALSGAIDGTTYDYVLQTMQTNSGSSPIRIAIAAIPVILTYLYRNSIEAEKNVGLNIAINLTIVNFVLTIIATFTSGLYVMRLATYLTPYAGIVYSYILTKGVPQTQRKQYTWLFYAFFLAYYIYAMGHQGAWGYNSEFLGKFSYNGMFSYTRP